jgi:hypothetical protein
LIIFADVIGTGHSDRVMELAAAGRTVVAPVSVSREYVMTVMWTILGSLLLIVWVLSVADIFRRHYSAGTTVGYLALVVILPFVGTMIYWAVRKPTAAEIEGAYRAEVDVQRSAASRPFDSTRV